MSERESREREMWVEVVFALPDEQTLVRLAWEPGLTAGTAVDRSKLAERFPQVDNPACALGIHGEKIERDHVLRPDDRVEICRPLQVDPRRMRLEMVSGGKVMGGRKAQPD